MYRMAALALIWNTIIINPMFNLLVGFYLVTKNLGLAIIVLTIVIRLILVPAMLPSLKTMKKQQDLKPELDKIKEKYKHDKKKQAEMQMELLKKHGINPASGCVTQLITIFILIGLYGVISKFATETNIAGLNDILYFSFLKLNVSEPINTSFFYLNLSKPDPLFILAVLSGAMQFLASKMTLPYVEAAEKAAQKTPDKTDDIAYNMQEQMLYTMPIMNVIFGITLPSGMMLYILVTTLFSIVQTYFVSGWGGLTPWINKVARILRLKK